MLTLKPNTEYHETHHPNTAAGMLLHAGTSTSSMETRYGTGETITAKQSCAPHNESQSRTRRTDAVGKKKVLKSRVLPLAEDFGALRHTGPGTIHVDRKVTVSGKGSVRLDTPAPWARRIQQTGITPPRRLSVPSTGKTCGNTTAFPFGYMWMHRAFI
mgnify:CR=1 FL=1